ncbi:MAG: site-specific DNA-methyltransferase [Chloroflexi bacterium]|nr:site-specific DNA-methyltransferase [Chloroflexota bacterium]MDL1885395.1 site-specific DNA-methyltransferase [Anaerolineae bacterium CFX8]
MGVRVDQVILGDCLEKLADIPDNSIDVCFADPPFNLDKKYATYDDQKSLDDYLAWCEKWLVELVRVTKPTGSILVHNIPKWLTYYAAILNKHAHFRHWIAWDAMSTPLGKTLLPAHYGILFYSKQAKGTKFFEIRAPHKTCQECGAYPTVCRRRCNTCHDQDMMDGTGREALRQVIYIRDVEYKGTP